MTLSLRCTQIAIKLIYTYKPHSIDCGFIIVNECIALHFKEDGRMGG
ncbi:MAG: hypothetical protein PHI32_05940 [Dysgonamonadaceae bacterium]|nr:hypothetical protein [Dysgonamonadaceae bacterium]